MKKISLLLLAVLCHIGLLAQSALSSQVVLTPYVVHDASTPTADKVLLDKLTRIVTKYGVSSSTGIGSPFIITGHAVELARETTATAPPHTAVEISLTLYIGNGEEGTVFSTCNMTLRGVGSDVDKAYAAAFKRININDSELTAAIDEGCKRIAKYYSEAGPGLIRQAETFAAAGDYAGAYGVLLRIPPVCPQYEEAQDLLLSLVHKESDANNGDILASARAAWSASPDEKGAAEAAAILGGMQNVSPKLRAEANALMKEMSARLQKTDDAERAAQAKREANAHAERLAAIEGATKVAVAQANRPIHYHIHWW